MPRKRAVKNGSFASHIDELVRLFSDMPMNSSKPGTPRSPELQEKIDIHAALFERAWRIDAR